MSTNPPFTTALLAGGIAGTTVDLTLFPLDTLKTRLQSAQGFFAAGGFRGIYRGIGSAALGSAPGAALFFCTYEATKTYAADFRRTALGSGSGGGGGGAILLPGNEKNQKDEGAAIDHMAAASLGEIAACAVRVPTEVIKQRAQAGHHGGSSLSSLTAILNQRATIGLTGIWRELYRGWGITIMREVPFTIIQFPIWESLKRYGRRRQDLDISRGEDVGVVESALYGSMAGAVAAGITTPLDVLKTRVMLSSQRTGLGEIVLSILRQHGVRPFFAGIGPRVAWISVGGAVFLGSYQWAVNLLERGRLQKAGREGLP
ncbi:S-adenosylmethionine transporter [Gnomoniopsis sp. IMI 355080]|nr:S-adenosylmethionine transporter [Gnomoniopsis sp. IMI 355080]